ncbi:MAG TPA: PEP-CTERM sorting domain-containing protein [Bryobacteraceae bacterium]|jgi:hypothetical protein|nr:PEP-CTERM sorting domain-containing protein [Bryobacteraceae bacterium]
MKTIQLCARWRSALCTIAGVFAFIAVPSQTQAAPFELIYNGVFNTQDALNPASQSTPTFFKAATPFTIRAWFDTSSPNLAPASPPAPPPFAGFRAYSPSVATIKVGNQTYSIENFNTNPTAGVTVAIFDNHSFTPGRYAVGILQEPPQDGAGIIGDFSSASPAFTADTLTHTTIYSGYNGVGYGSGVCTGGPGVDCAITPFVLHNGNQTWDLTLGNYEEVYPGGSDPVVGPPGPLNRAELLATPEPGTLAVAFGGLAFLFGLARRRKS